MKALRAPEDYHLASGASLSLDTETDPEHYDHSRVVWRQGSAKVVYNPRLGYIAYHGRKLATKRTQAGAVRAALTSLERQQRR